MTRQELTTVAVVKQLAGITDSNSDPIIQSIADAVVSVFSNYVNRRLDEHIFTEYRNGNGSNLMVLANYPIVMIQSVEIDGMPITPSPDGRSNGYSCTTGSRTLVLRGSVFNQGKSNICISGIAGYGGDNLWPHDLAFAAAQWVIARYNERLRIGKGSQSLAGQAMTYVPDAANGTPSSGMPSAAATILSNYMNRIPETGY